MKPEAKFRVSSFEFRAHSSARHSSFVIRAFARAFTLIELLTVIAIIGILAALLTPVLKGLAKPDVSVSATRQMLDDLSRARALAISDRSTVYMVFIPTNFWTTWGNPPNFNGTLWNQIPAAVRGSMITTQAYGAQMNGYFLISLRDVGDQPGQPQPRDLLNIKTLPQGVFFAPYKFTAPLFDPNNSNAVVPYPINRPDLPIYGFPKTNTIPFPTATVLTNTGYASTFKGGAGLTLPYIAFNYLGQLTGGDGSVLPYDENIPLDYGNISPALSAGSKLPTQQAPTYNEEPPGNSTNIQYNLIHVDRLTGRARLERQDAL